MDSLDRDIIKHLQKDARLSLRELGKKLNTPHTTVFTRVNKLVKKGVIKKFSAVLHPQDFGLKLNFFVIDTSQMESRDLAASISDCQDVMKVYTTADGKIIVKAVSEDGSPQCLADVISKVGEGKVSVYPVEAVHKYDHDIHDDFIDNIE